MGVPTLLSKAVALIKEGRTDEALACCDQALAIKDAQFPGMVWAIRGAILRDAKRYREALGCFEKAQELGEDSDVWIEFCKKALGVEAVPRTVPQEEELLTAALRMIKEGLPDAALTCCDKVLKSGDPKYAAEAWKTKALVYQAANKDTKALGCLEQAANLGNKFAEKAAEMLRKKIQEAASKAQPAQAEDADALFNRGELLTNQGRPAEALACFEKALEVNPQSAYTWYSRGVALGQLDRPKDEIASYDQALKINPKFAEAWYNKAITLGNARQFREALTCFEKAKALDYADADQGISYCKSQLEATGSGVTAESAEWLQKGTDVIVNGGDPQEALDCFEKSLAINPRSERAWWGKALQLDKLGRLEEALAAFDQALTIDPDSAAILMSKAGSLYNAKQFQAAMGCYEKARELGNPTAVQGVISCRMMLGRAVPG